MIKYLNVYNFTSKFQTLTLIAYIYIILVLYLTSYSCRLSLINKKM